VGRAPPGQLLCLADLIGVVRPTHTSLENEMEKIAVFVNDAAHARHVLEPLLEGGRPTRWIVVACAPKLTRHIGRWVSNAARTQSGSAAP